MSEPDFAPSAAGAPGRVIIIEGETFLFDTPLLLKPLQAVPLLIVQAWAQQLEAVMLTKMQPGWDTVLASQDSFNTLLADKAALGYAPFANPTFTTRRGHSAQLATRQHDRHLHAAYSELVFAIAQLFGAGLEDYRARVQHARDRYREGERVPLSLTGAYVTQILECAVRHWWWISSNPKLNRFRNPLDYREGDWPPSPAFLPDGPKWDAARFHQYGLVQLGCLFLLGIPYDHTLVYLSQWLTNNLRHPDYAQAPESSITVVSVDGTPHIRTAIALGGV